MVYTDPDVKVLFQSLLLRPEIGFTEELWILTLKGTTCPAVPGLAPTELDESFSPSGHLRT